MPIYYVDTVEGSDASDGLSWAQAWKTCYPLKAIYGMQGAVRDIEVRIAKTTPVETDRQLAFDSLLYSPTLMCWATGRPFAGFRKTVIPDAATHQATVMSYRGTVISPFFSDSEGTSPAFRPGGTYKFRLDALSGSNGLAARWTLADGNFSSFETFEFIAAFRYFDSDDPCTAEAWLEFSTDSAGSNIIWSRKITPGTTRYEARMCLVGNNDLPDGASYAFLRINNPTPFTVHLDCTSMHAVLPVTHPNYYGLREIYVPNSKMGSTLCPSTTLNPGHTVFVGIDSRAMDDYFVDKALPPRTWSVHRWQAYPYAPEALLPSCSIAGSPASPLKIYGGWNKATGLVDGISAIDAANIRWFNSARVISVDVRNLAVACRRTGKVNLGGTPGIMEYAGLGMNRQLLGARAENVYLPAGGPGCVGEDVGFYYSDMPRESLISVPGWGISVGSDATVRNCNTALDLPFAGGVAFTTLEDSAWGMANVFHHSPGARVSRCRLWEIRTELTGGSASAYPVTYDDCDIVSILVSDAFENEYICAPRAYMENCRLWGAHTGPISTAYPAKNLQYTPLPGVTGALCTHGADIDGLRIEESDPTYHTTDSMFARTGYNGDPVKVTLKNANVQMIFATFVPISGSYDYRGHEVVLQEVVLHRTGASNGAPFVSSRLRVDGLTLVGAWPALQTGIIRTTDVTRLVFTDANTKIADNFKFAAPAVGWGRVCASYRNVVHPLGLDGFLGTPASGFFSAAAAWFHTLSGEMWASALMTVRKDHTLSHSGLTSWRMTALQPIGAISAGSFMVGVVPVVAGVPITFSAALRRDSPSAIGGIYLRPGITRQWTAQEEVNVPSLHDVVAMQSTSVGLGQWEVLTVSYTPFRDGLVELHAGMRGMTGARIWLDTLKVTQ